MKPIQKAEIKRHPGGIAFDIWISSGECDDLVSKAASEEWMFSRLKRAFIAGWEAHERHIDDRRT